jgi:hypothetical protein
MTPPIRPTPPGSPSGSRPVSPVPEPAPPQAFAPAPAAGGDTLRQPPSRAATGHRQRLEGAPRRPSADPAGTDPASLNLPVVAQFLGERDRLTLGQVSASARAEIPVEWRASHIALIEAPAVQTSAAFRRLLGAPATQDAAGHGLRSLPPAFQAGPLLALGARLNALPAAQQQAAIDAFLATPLPAGVAPPAILADLREAALAGAAGLRRREARLTGHDGAAHAAVAGGEPVAASARRFAITGAQAIERLEDAAMPRVHRALDRGEAVAVAARGAGITSPARLDDMQRHAALGAGTRAVRQGEPPHEVAARLGIHHPAAIGILNHRGAMHEIGLGASVPETARRLGITGVDTLLGLELHAAETAGQAAVQRGESVITVARRLGITQPNLVLRLEAHAVAQQGVDAVRRGESVRAVSERLGIRAPQHLAALAEAAQELPPAKRPRLG